MIAASGTDDWMIEVLRGAMQTAQARHRNIVLLTYPEMPDEVDRLVESLRGRAFDGVLVVQPRDRLPWLEDARAEGFPVSVLDDHGTNTAVDAFVPDESVASIRPSSIWCRSGVATSPCFPVLRKRRRSTPR